MRVVEFTDHRWGTRFDLVVAASVIPVHSERAMALIRDASISGAFLETEMRLPNLSRVIVQPHLPDATGHEAIVVRCSEKGFAVEWVQPGAQTLMPLLPTGSPEARELSRDQRHLLNRSPGAV